MEEEKGRGKSYHHNLKNKEKGIKKTKLRLLFEAFKTLISSALGKVGLI